jgi:hypothetical protein
MEHDVKVSAPDGTALIQHQAAHSFPAPHTSL